MTSFPETGVVDVCCFLEREVADDSSLIFVGTPPSLPDHHLRAGCVSYQPVARPWYHDGECPECGRAKQVVTLTCTLIGKNGSLADPYPEIAKQRHPAKNGDPTPNDVCAGSGGKVWW